jgi:ParB family chromosome partitioning protein
VTVEASSTDKFVPYRGALRAAIADGALLRFVTVHPEGRATALYELDVDKSELVAHTLPGHVGGDPQTPGPAGGGNALVADATGVYVAGTDGQIYKSAAKGGKISALGPKLDPAPIALALLDGNRLAALAGSEVLVLDRKSGAAKQRLPLPEEGSALAADASGRFLVAGTSRGTIAVFDAEDRDDFAAGEAKKLHEGAVSALLFDPDELRVYSTGSDNRLLLTHVRGALEPEDRTGGSGHDALPTAIVIGPEDKLYTAGRDGAIKTWTRGPQKRRPSTQKDGVATAVGLARVEHKGRPHLAVLGEDGTIRLFPLDAGGKVGDRVLTFRDAYALAENELGQREPARRKEALDTLAGYDDARSIQLIAAQASADADHALKVHAATLLGKTKNARAQKPLEELLGAPEEQVRLAALAGLRALEGEASLRPLDLALAKKKRDLGVAAVSALLELAKKDDQATMRLVAALDEDPIEVRGAAAGAIEALHDARAGKKAPSPEGGLVALRSRRPDVRRLALLRFFQRKLLDAPEVQAALRRHEGDADADVRRAAFLVSVMARPALAEALRARDRDLHRQLRELETFGQKEKDKEAAEAEPPKPKKSKAELSDEDLRPLFEAMASRQLDTCLLGARGLAALGDERAFGTLLQLTNEKTPAARVEACKALAELGDPRAGQRLRQMLRDGAGEVRDAAFTALSRLLEKTPLAAAEAGLLAPNEDVRGRGLSALVRHLKKEAKGAEPEAIALLERALNDTASAVRSEAFKAALSLEIGGDAGAAPLEFALESIHADVRKEVLGEVMGRIQEAWAPALLTRLFADPDAGVRGEAFDFAQRRSKGKAAEPLAAAIGGKYADLKLKAIDSLSKKRVDGARELLAKALGDEDEKVRIAAVSAMFVDEVDAAMESAHPDVRVRAAAARAGVGDARALAPLLALVTEKEPDLADKRPAWIDRVTRALAGLADLGAGNADVLRAVAALATHKEKAIRDMAVRALGWVSKPGGDTTALFEALAHPDKDVKQEAAFGLALVGDPAGLSVLKGLGGAATPLALRCLGAAVSIGRQADDLLAAFLDHNDEKVRARALCVMMLLESSEHDGVPDHDGAASGPKPRVGGAAPERALAALSSAHPRVRLAAARALETFADPAAFRAFVVELANDRGDDKAAWTIPADTVRSLGEVLAWGDPQLKGRAVRLLEALDEEKQDRFDREWEGFRKRFEKDLASYHSAGEKKKPAASAYSPEDLARVVLGAYAGLSRMAGGPLEMRVRQTAIARLVALAKGDRKLAPSVQPLLLLGLGDPAREVRKLAFDSLAGLGMSAAELGAEALAVGQRDVGVLGLGLLAGDKGESKPAARKKVLEQVLLDATDGLEEEAGKLLAEITGWEEAHVTALEAQSPAARDRAVAGLAQLYEASAGAQKALRGALSSRFQKVRERAAFELAEKKDAAAFDALVGMLRGETQKRAIDALVRLGDARAPDALLDRVENDPAGDAQVDALFAAAGGFRAPASAARLLGHLADKKRRRAAFGALLAVSGYDQPIADPNDERAGTPDRVEHPRRDDVLAKLVDAAYRLGDFDLLGKLLPSARWAKDKAIDAVLAPLCSLNKDELRSTAVEAAGFRLRKRGGPAEPLVAALAHPNPITQFLAAEGLALAGRAEGIRVLLTAIDMVPDLDQRRRAVRALGRLGDARALDALLRLVNEDGHALQEEAAEAIGNLRATPKGKQIEELLLRLAKGTGGVALAALAGLRWFDSREGWTFLRSRAKDDDAGVRAKVVELLAFDSDQASRVAIVERVENERAWHVASKAAESLRRWEQPDSLEPDYVLLGATLGGLGGDVVERLRERGDAARILSLLPKIQPANEGAYLRPLVAALLARDPLPIEAAAAHLESPHERVVAAAAQIVARGGKAAAKAHGKAVASALRKAAEAWQKARADIDRGRATWAELAPATERYRRLVEAAGKLETGAEEIIAAASITGDDAAAQGIRMAALSALAGGFAKKPGLDALALAVTSDNGRARSFAAAALRALAPDRAAELLGKVADDRSALARLLGSAPAGTSALHAAAAKVHTQGAALPHLVAAGDVAGVAAVLRDKKLPEATRLGAIEALGRIATAAAFDALSAVASASDEDEELRKAAFRAIRRGRRYEKKREAKRDAKTEARS